ncbi:MAG: hypothetical protein RI568_07655 [Natronomonas sp.]|jgi:hypothetical protein|uniref:Uncharacterized protein n=1 Tax=Natronomonas salsuginis TaxID=2217661 RepID=A0A4U5JH79_9EURY|nr:MULTISPECIES: hypothetical protein [Natronomonas]MDR9430561.1 hypothetical protein [Natronomonas sp.]TKR27661.1 hypothetical protein DM868_00800 [Natronomonas salsuginis]
MQQATFVKLSALAFGLVALSFVIRGFSRLVVTPETAAMFSAPTMLAGGALIAFLTLRSVLAVSGIRPLE